MGTISLATMPFSLANLLFLLAARAACLAILVWFQLMRAIITVPLHLCWRLMVWTTALMLLPVRILTALQKERTLEMNLNEIQIQLESLTWENKELEEQLQMAIKDRKIFETIFDEIEEEHEKALSRIDLLENELQDLKAENLRVKEVEGKAVWNYKARDDGGAHVREGIPLAAPTWGSNNKGGGVRFEDILMHGGKPKEQHILKAAGPCPPHHPQEIPRGGLIMEEAVERRIALHRSLFSAILSMLVGMIIWEAEDPCMPLVVALFTVVGMSLSSVVRFLLTVRNKPASDVVALLSMNWFILGTLSAPSLPSVASTLAPPVMRLADGVASWVGLSADLTG